MLDIVCYYVPRRERFVCRTETSLCGTQRTLCVLHTKLSVQVTVQPKKPATSWWVLPTGQLETRDETWTRHLAQQTESDICVYLRIVVLLGAVNYDSE